MSDKREVVVFSAAGLDPTIRDLNGRPIMTGRLSRRPSPETNSLAATSPEGTERLSGTDEHAIMATSFAQVFKPSRLAVRGTVEGHSVVLLGSGATCPPEWRNRKTDRFNFGGAANVIGFDADKLTVREVLARLLGRADFKVDTIRTNEPKKEEA